PEPHRRSSAREGVQSPDTSVRFSYGYGVPPGRPSFPTRRSSDLARSRHEYLPVLRLPPHRHASEGCRRLHLLPRPTTAHHHTRADRKSTRLNSSHVKTSYAVSCLKKKTHDTALAKLAATEATVSA